MAARATAAGMVEQDAYVKAVTEIVSALIKAYEIQIPINLSKMKGEVSRKHKYDKSDLYFSYFIISCCLTMADCHTCRSLLTSSQLFHQITKLDYCLTLKLNQSGPHQG